MARRARRWEPHAIHHAVARAHCGSPIFALDEDRGFVVRRAARAFAESGATCLAWAILNNHYHVLLRCEGPPGPTFSRLNTAIAWRVLRHRGEHGSVFQNRYYSDPCETEGSLMGRLAYVLGNPVHHRVVPSIEALRTYEWSSLGEILGLRTPRWVDVDAALALMDSDPGRARRTLLQFLEAKAAEWAADGGDPDEDRGLAADRPESEVPSDSLDRGPPDAAAGAGRAPRVEPPPSLRDALRREGWTPDRLVEVACAMTGAHAQCVRAGAHLRVASAARSVIAFVACDVAGVTMAEVAPFLGVGPTALVCARRRGRERLAEMGLAPEDLLARSRGKAALPPGV
jgi:hypothetical protein